MKKQTAIIDIQCQSEREFGFDRIAMRIARFPEVMSVRVLSGKSDLMVRIEAESIEKISRFVTEILAPMEGIISTSTSFVLKRYKMNGKMLVTEQKKPRIPISL